MRFQGEGETRDVSVCGVYVITTTCPPPGAELQIELTLSLSNKSSELRMSSDVMVLRVEHDITGKNPSGFSAVGAGFSLRNPSKAALRTVNALIKRAEPGVEEEA